MKGPPKSREADVGRRNPDARNPDAQDRDDRQPSVRPASPSGGRDRPERNGNSGHEAPASRRLSGSAAVAHAKAHLADLTNQQCEAVSALNRTREGWRVVLEVLELERIPRTTDILASYAVDLDENGDLMGYERIHRYYRNDVSGDQ